MNWNDNVNTQDGHKVKLLDFINDVSGVDGVVAKLDNAVKVYERTVTYTEETSDGSIELVIPKPAKGAMHCIVLLTAESWNTEGDYDSYVGRLSILLNGGSWDNDYDYFISNFKDVSADVNDTDEGLRVEYSCEPSGGIANVNIKLICFSN